MNGFCFLANFEYECGGVWLLDVVNYDFTFFEFQFLLTYWTTSDVCDKMDIIYELIMQRDAREAVDDRVNIEVNW